MSTDALASVAQISADDIETLAHLPVEAFRTVRQRYESLRDSGSPERLAVAALYADLARFNTLYMIARAGSGHIGSSFSSLDIVSWVFLNEVKAGVGDRGFYNADHSPLTPALYFSSKGHDAPGLYAALLGLELLDWEKIHELRRLGGLPGHPDIKTPWMEANTGSLGMGVSKAKGIAFANRLAGHAAQRLYVMTGDGELQEGQFWESLVGAANGGFGEITVIVDHNKFQSDTFVKRVSDLGDLEAKFRAYGWLVARCDGHDLPALEAAVRSVQSDPQRPGVVIADTIKGRGVSFMEPGNLSGEALRLYPYHSGAPAPEKYAAAIAELGARIAARWAELALPADVLGLVTYPRPPRPNLDGVQKLVAAYSRALVEEAAKRPNLIALDADLALDTGLIEFEKQFPERFVECGIAEMDMVSQAGAMARKGLLPIVHSFACFLSTRPNEQIFNNATERSQVIYAGSLAGLVPGGPGHSHQCVRDISSLGGIPGMVMLEPSCEAEVAPILAWCLDEHPAASYIRFVSIPCRIPYELPAGYTLQQGRGGQLRGPVEAAGSITIIGYGPVLLPEAWHAAERIEAATGQPVRLFNLPWLNTVDAAWLAGVVAGAKLVVTLDNHLLKGGQGEMLAAALAGRSRDLGSFPSLLSLGLTETPRCGLNPEVLKAHGLDAEGIAKAVSLVLA